MIPEQVVEDSHRGKGQSTEDPTKTAEFVSTKQFKEMMTSSMDNLVFEATLR